MSTPQLLTPPDQRFGPSAIVLGMIATAVIVAMLLLGVIPGVGDKIGLGLALLLVLGPALAYSIVKAPTLAFAGYAVFVPLENLIHIGTVGTLAKALGAASGALLVIMLIVRRQAIPPGRSVLAWGALLAWMGVSLLWALDPNFGGTVNLIQVLQLFILYVIVGMVPFKPRDLNIVLFGAVFGGFVAGLYSINQYMHGVHPVNGWQRLVVQNGEEAVDFNHFAASLQMPIAIAWSAVMSTRSNLKRYIYCVPLGTMFVGMLLGASRGGIIGLGLMTLYLAWRTRNFKALGGVMLIGLVASFAFPSVWSRFTDPSQGEGSGRLPIWRVGFEAFKHHWLAGVGVGNFQVAYDNVFLRVYQDEFQGWSRPSHNVLVGTGTELGIIGLALLIWATVAQFRSLRIIGPTNQLYPVRVALEAGMWALIAESMFIDILWYKYLWLGFALMAAVRATAITCAKNTTPLSPPTAFVSDETPTPVRRLPLP